MVQDRQRLLVSLLYVAAMAAGIQALFGLAHVQAQAPAVASVQELPPEAIDNIVSSARPDTPATLRVANRDIVVFQAALLGRSPAERVRGAAAIVGDEADRAETFQVASRSLRGAAMVSVNGRDVFAIVPADVDPLVGETVEARAAEAVSRLDLALRETTELHHTRDVVLRVAEALLATVLFVGALWLVAYTGRRLVGRLQNTAERTLLRSSVADELVRETRLLHYVRAAGRAVFIVVGLSFGYVWLFFVLRRFPYSRPWGEAVRSFLVDRVVWLAEGVVGAVPDLFTIVLIFFVVRFANRFVRLFFMAVEQGRVTFPGVYPETAVPTRQLATILLWVFGLVVSYPYLPGSDTDAFKGVSVFIGLIVSLGSSGLVNQVMSGFTVTYSRALRPGDYVQIGETLGTVTAIGTLSTKLETPAREEVTIPNAVLISQTVTNYSRLAETKGVYVGTEVTIGYDAPWRQVNALLLMAANRTAGIRRDPPPLVWQRSLEDFYVRYRLLISLEQPNRPGAVMNELHANIQDAFNEFGVQIMSPNYEADPNAPKVVPKGQWFAAPAGPATPAEGHSSVGNTHATQE